jgi:hypothetical protein
MQEVTGRMKLKTFSAKMNQQHVITRPFSEMNKQHVIIRPFDLIEPPVIRINKKRKLDDISFQKTQ